MSIPARQSTAKTFMVGPILDADGVAVTGAAISALKISKNGGAPAAFNGSATLTHRHTGHYSLAATTSDLDTVGTAEVVIDSTTNAMPVKVLMVLPAHIYDFLFTDGTGVTLNLKKLNIVNDSGDALVAQSTGSNGHGIAASGHGTGTGLRAVGGATGRGIHGLGGATSGHGMHVEGTTLGHGLLVEGRGENPNPGHALVARAVDADGNGIYCKGIGDGDGLHAEGADSPGAGQGIVARAGVGADTAGMSCLGDGSHGGLEVHGGTNGGSGFVAGGNGAGGNGILAVATDTGNGIFAQGGLVAGHGTVSQARTSGAGVQALGAGGANAGLYAEGGDVNGSGIWCYGYGTGAGLEAEGDTGDGFRAKSWGSGKDIQAGEIDALPVATADAVLTRDWLDTVAAVGTIPARSALNALRFLRNAWVIAAGILKVSAEDDDTDTPVWSKPVTPSPGADPLSGVGADE